MVARDWMAIWFSAGRPAVLRRSVILMWSPLLLQVRVRATSFMATWASWRPCWRPSSSVSLGTTRLAIANWAFPITRPQATCLSKGPLGMDLGQFDLKKTLVKYGYYYWCCCMLAYFNSTLVYFVCSVR
jgi:hypothetical protein